MENFSIAEYCETLECTVKGQYLLTHNGGSLSTVPANVKKLSMKQAKAYYEKHFPRPSNGMEWLSWSKTVKEVNRWIEWEKSKAT